MTIEKNLNVSDKYKEYSREEFLSDLKRLYPTENFEDKYILLIQNSMYVPYSDVEVNVDIIVKFKYGSIKEISDFKIRTPYPNRLIYRIDRKNGRKLCDFGLPLFFDTFEEISAISSIVVKWKFLVKNKKKGYYLNLRYNLDIKHDDSYKIYSLCDKNWFKVLPVDEMLINMIDNFDTVRMIQIEKDSVSSLNIDCDEDGSLYSYKSDDDSPYDTYDLMEDELNNLKYGFTYGWVCEIGVELSPYSYPVNTI